MTRPPRGDALNAVDDAPVRPRLRDRQGPAGLHSLQWRVEIGRIYETRGGPDNLRWFWSMPDDKIERSDDLGDANFRRVGMPGRHGRIGAARRLGDTDNS